MNQNDSKLNNLPDGWKWVKLGEVCDKVESVKRSLKPLTEKLLYLDIGGIDNQTNKIISHKEYTWENAPSRAQQIVFKNDTLFSTVRTYLKNIALIENSIYDEQIASSGFTVIRGKKDLLNHKYIFYHAISQSFLQPLNELQTGSSYPAVRDKDVFAQLIPLPPLSIQAQIVEKLEAVLSELDKGKAQLLTAQAQLKTYRQAVLKYAFEGKLTGGTEGWEWVKTGDIMQTINNGYTPKSHFLSEGKGEIPFIKVYNLNFDGTLNFAKNPTFIPKEIHEKDLKRSICYPNDVLINIVGPPLGKVSVITNQFPEWNINQAIVLFRPNEKILSKFLSYFLQNPNTINWLEGTSKATAGQWNVKVSTCREIPLYLPPLSIQEKIVTEIESRLSVCDKLEETLKASLVQCETLRQSVLKRAFEGRLV